MRQNKLLKFFMKCSISFNHIFLRTQFTWKICGKELLVMIRRPNNLTLSACDLCLNVGRDP
jgi:hypothetical protein